MAVIGEILGCCARSMVSSLPSSWSINRSYLAARPCGTGGTKFCDNFRSRSYAEDTGRSKPIPEIELL
jgi:hypothetical protein